MPRLLLVALPLLLAADWPQHLGPSRDGHSSETGLLRTWPKDGPGVVWKREVGAGWAGPAVAGDRLVLFHRVGDQEVVECLDPATGTGRWKAAYRTAYVDEFEFDNGPRASPLIADGRVSYTRRGRRTAGVGPGDREGPVGPEREQGLSRAERLLRRRHLSRARRRQAARERRGQGGRVVAFDPASGKELWKTANDAVSYSSPTVAKIGGEELAVFFTREGLLAVSPERGNVRYATRSGRGTGVGQCDDPGRVRRPRVPVHRVPDRGDSPGVEEGQSRRSVARRGHPVHALQHAGAGERPPVRDRRAAGEPGDQAQVRRMGDGQGALVEGRLRVRGPRSTRTACSSPARRAGRGPVEATPNGYKELGRSKVLDEPVRALPALADGRLFVRDGKKLVALAVGKK